MAPLSSLISKSLARSVVTLRAVGGALLIGGVLVGGLLVEGLAEAHPTRQGEPRDDLEAAAPDPMARALEELSAAPAETFMPALEAAFVVFRERALDLDFEAAIRVGIGMHEEVLRRGEPYFLTSGWSATQLALAYTRSGKHEAAEGLLSASIEAFELRQADLRAMEVTPEQQAQIEGLNRGLVGLLNRRSMSRLAAGDEAGGCADLGAGLARGSMNARLILARRALRRSESPESRAQGDGVAEAAVAETALREKTEARRIFSTLLEEEPGIAAWALRGWGLTLLPPSRTQSP